MNFALPPLAVPADAEALLPAGAGPALQSALATAWVHSPFLKGLARSRAAVLRQFSEAGPAAAIDDALAMVATHDPETHDPETLAPRLRRARGDVALVVALADLAGLWPLETVTAALSDFADAAIHAAIAAALAERDAPNRGLVALALGKLGSRELNYSSDVDLILLHDPDRIPRRAHEEPDEAAVRIARRAVALLADQTADGYVARVDLRLRPASEITPMSLSIGAAEHYYQAEAETWERLAFVRARAVGGDLALGQGFLERIRPFVWRRSLDFTAVRDVQSVSLRIRDHFEAGQKLGPGFDLKRGRGGIREVEFFTQIHQLIWGGREPALRCPATLDALQALVAADRIEASEAAQLAASYRALRTVEHRLQMRRDEQTHMVPKLAADRAAVARLCGAPDWPSVQSGLARVTSPVAAAYDRLIRAAAPEATPVPADATAWLKRRHPRHLKLVAPLIERWRSGSVRALRSDPARAAFERLLPSIIDGVTTAAEPIRAAARLDSFFGALPPAAQFLALLEANPRLVGLLAHLLGVAPTLADALARAPALFDVMLAPDAFAPLPDAAALSAELDRFIGSGSFEQRLDRVRRWTSERRFQLGAQIIEGRADPLAVARSLAAIADAAMDAIVPAVTAEMVAAHGRVPGTAPLVLAMGRYGGGMLTHASDLDLIYLFKGNSAAVSDGATPITAARWYNRWAQRLTSALSVPTAEGTLYEVDTRLCPWGVKGMMMVSLESFARYQAEEAAPWEHMALTRARVVAGDATAINAVIAAQLGQPRDPATLRHAVLAMRADIARAKPPGGLYDVKLGPGGLVDLEFIIHFLQLGTPQALPPDMDSAIARLATAGRIEPERAAELQHALALLTRWLVVLRLVAPGIGRAGSTRGLSPATEAVIATALGAASFPAAVDALALARSRVRLAWEALLEREQGG
ncbi:glutamate-ammonia-ligase adenylyltransferase [Polymorphobacter multimanifer]|uniref:bifunctional [glutamine synthetase] adenylyltransferase/[glutamine synthetase]-adenylyl-L-tyrosine phosphorylase n=1 Tax=Polymorphobacter multimanifer TaxID=1070431 RepID=UPI001667F344|nr:bifunctional [glutamine synthetase] adenylyltransferase/[glutamine synthetase]-adenylyl-L-tyrosine phosphorylase [Polymorphobacter multimanifer]GGI67220.1 glutamate-ammonia-ligase adenylyltransferase [Polymorphobacter multimanifer]